MRSLQIKSAWLTAMLTSAGLALACVGTSGVLPNPGPPSAAAQAAAAANGGQYAASSGLATDASGNVVSGASVPTPVSTPIQDPLLPGGGWVVYGNPAAKQALDLTQFFDANYNIDGTPFVSGFALDGTKVIEVRFLIQATGPNGKASRPQFAIATPGFAPYYTHPINYDYTVLNAGFISLGSGDPNIKTVDYIFSIIDTGVAPNNVIYTITMYLKSHDF